MTQSKLKLNFYLKTNLPYPSVDFKWTDDDNEKFLVFIYENCKKDFLKKDKNLLEIKQAFQKYFESIGYILFQIKDYKIRLKIFPYKIEPKNSANVDAIIDIIDQNEQFIVNEYNGKKDQILIQDELRKIIFDFVESIEEEKVNKKELVRFAVREAFELKDSDIIMVKKDCIFIKLCDVIQKKEIPINEKNTIANRYNGIPEEELDDFNKEHFSNKGNKRFFNLAAKLVVDRYLLDKKINNLEYEKYIFSYIQLIIAEQLMNTFDHCEDFFKGFSGYIFRLHFEEVFEQIAELILIEVAMSNEYMIDFLKYYSLDVLVIDGKKYKVPMLEAENGLKWNVVSMLSIVKLYVKSKLASKIILNDIDKKEEEVISLYKDGLSPVEYNKKNTEEKKILADMLFAGERKLDACYDSLKFAKNENEKDTLQNEISLIKVDMAGAKEANEKLSSKTANRSDLNKYTTLEKEIDSLKRQLKREERVLEQNAESFLSIKTALVKALTSKKQKI